MARNELGFALQVIVWLHTDTASGQVLHFLFYRVLAECHVLKMLVSKFLFCSTYKKEMGKKMDLDEERETSFFCEQVKRYLQLFLNLETKL